MNIPVVEIIYGASLISAVPVVISARRHGRRSPAFDGLVAAAIPVLGVVMYVSSIRLGLTPPPLEKEPEPVALEPSGSLLGEMTAEVKRLRARVAELEAQLAKRSPSE